MPTAAPAHASNMVQSAPTSVDLVVADATWFSTEHLFAALERPGIETLLLKCLDYRNALARGWSPWTWRRPTHARSARLWERELILPSGWMKSFPGIGMRPIAATIREWRRERAGKFVLVITYPHYLYLRDMVQPDQTVYFNIDDYAQYWPSRAKRVLELERQAVRESDLTVCVSQVRAAQLRAMASSAASRIRYLPHGCPDWALAGRESSDRGAPPLDLSVIPGPHLGYVGSLEDRVDWNLLTQLAQRIPNASLVLVGKVLRDGDEVWHDERRRCLALPNVRVLGWKPQDELLAYIQAFDVCLIPYRMDHAFNRVCNPTKIMDYMGSGRPIVATALPECQAHAARFDVAETAQAFVESVRSLLAKGGDDGRSGLRLAFARQHSCGRVAERLMDWLSSA